MHVFIHSTAPLLLQPWAKPSAAHSLKLSPGEQPFKCFLSYCPISHLPFTATLLTGSFTFPAPSPPHSSPPPFWLLSPPKPLLPKPPATHVPTPTTQLSPNFTRSRSSNRHCPLLCFLQMFSSRFSTFAFSRSSPPSTHFFSPFSSPQGSALGPLLSPSLEVASDHTALTSVWPLHCLPSLPPQPRPSSRAHRAHHGYLGTSPHLLQTHSALRALDIG